MTQDRSGEISGVESTFPAEQPGASSVDSASSVLGCAFKDCFKEEKAIVARKFELRNGPSPVGSSAPDDSQPLSHGRFAADDLFGLALSGGGIRSASFAIGVVQALERLNVLRFFHYLSTVSGGGFVGGAMTWHSHQNSTAAIKEGIARKRDPGCEDDSTREGGPAEKENRDSKKDTWSFAFGKPWEGARNRAASEDGSTKHELIDWIRHQGDYLRPRFSLGSFNMILLVLVNVGVSLAIYFACLTLVILAAYSPACIASRTLTFADCRSDVIPELLKYAVLIGIAILATLHVLASSLTWRQDVRIRRLQGIRYRMRTLTSVLSTWMGLISLILIGLASLTYVHRFLIEAGSWTLWAAIGVVFSIGALLATLKSGILDATRSLAAAPKPARLRIICFAALIIYVSAVACFHILVSWNLGVVVAASLSAIVLGLIINTNYFGLHRYYRDRLTETFLSDSDAIRANKWGPAWFAEEGKLGEIGGPEDPGLYHLINTNLVINRHSCASWDRRGCDNFVFSHAYCGSSVTRWFRTQELGVRDSTLGTAMAISGAAVNPGTGAEGTMGRNWFVTAAMRFLNLRLGYWVENPLQQRSNAGSPFRWWPNFINPGLWHGLIGARVPEEAAFLELTDGGHFDNTGIYELVRRRLRLIVVSDAGADADYRFDDISRVIELVRADFGTTIEFLEDRGLDDLVPRSGGDDAFLTKLGFARRGHAVARIYYRKNPEGERDETGLLIVVKPTIIAGLPHDIYNYHASHDSFPAQPTSNQFFTERQLEAYRELGYQLAKRMVEDGEVTDWFPDYVRDDPYDASQERSRDALPC